MKRLAVCFFLVACGGNDPASGLDVSAIDKTADPCSDFFRYACGAFLDANMSIAANGALVQRRSAAFYATEQVEQQIVASPAGDSDSSLLGTVDQACTGAAGGQQPHTRLDQALAAIDGLASLTDLPKTLAPLHDAGLSALFYFGVVRDLQNPTQLIAQVATGGFGMLTASWNDPSGSYPSAYHDHIVALAQLFGDSDAMLPAAVFSVEKSLAAAALPPDFWRDPTQTFHRLDAPALAALAPHFDFAAYGGPGGTVDVTEPDYFTKLDSLLTTVSLDDWKRYLRWRSYERFAATMGDDKVAEEYKFHQGVFYGFSTPLPRGEYCLRATDGLLQWPMAHEYSARVSVDRSGAQSQMDRIVDRMHDTLSAADWLDDATRGEAIAKLSAVRVEIGAPSGWPQYSPTVATTSYADDAAAISSYLRQLAIMAIGGMSTGDWFLSPEQVNAAYSWPNNAINIPDAILQAPLFSGKYGDPINYGAIGAVMGHELTHGFDDMGRKFDAGGTLRDWWTPSVATAFQSRAQCLVDQYTAIQTPVGPIDGTLTLGENIADLGGVRLALAALSPSTRSSHGYTETQLFFLAYAQSWCTVERNEALMAMLRTDFHAPASARVNAVLANVAEFAQAFSCAPGAPMAPANRCQVW
jgi:predicted metalloendopeptidase